MTFCIPAGLKEITTIELFTQNYLKYDHISFTVWKRIKFYVYPPGARLSRPSHLFTQRLYFFCKISDPKFEKKIRTPLSTFQTPALPYNYSAPGGWHRIPKSHRNTKSKKLWFTSFNVQNHFSKTLIKYA